MPMPVSNGPKALPDHDDHGSRGFSPEAIINISLDSLSSFKKTLSPKGAKEKSFREDLIVEIADTLAELSKLRIAIIAVQGVIRFLQKRQDPQIPKGQIENLVRQRDSDLLQELGGVGGLAEKLRVNPRTGVGEGSQHLVRRRIAFGENVYPKKASKSFWHFLWEGCKDTTLVILMFCAILSLVFGIRSEGVKEGWYEGASIGFAVILVIVVTAASDYRQSRQFRSLNREKENIQVQVLRGGRRTFVSIFEIVVGDIVELRIGDQVPADGLFVAGQALAIDESSMTGESDAFVPNDKVPFLLSGSKVQDGNGSMLVTAVGINTEWGQMMAAISSDTNEETPLQSRLRRAAVFIGKAGLSVAFLVLVILVVFYFTGHTSSGSSGTFESGVTTANQIANSVVNIFSIAVTIVVVAVPEGLPLAVTLTLAYSMRKMMADKALVRRLSACETMGSATTICSDKTGTLTMNQMTVVKEWIAGSMSGSNGENLLAQMETRTRDLLFVGIAQNSTGSIFVPPGAGAEQAEVSGSPTEKALLSWGLKAGMKFNDMQSNSTVMKAEPFNSTRKRAGMAVRMPNGKVLVHWKGAAEIILKACDKWVSADGEVKELRIEKREELEKAIQTMAGASLRCVAFAYCEAESNAPDDVEHWTLPDTELAMLAVVGIQDPCRPGVKKAIEKAKRAGVRVRMVTGDNLATAKAIATECTILETGDEAVEGATFRLWNEAEMREKLPRVSVIARALPTDKLLLVQTLQGMGEVVAVTGDGSNDAPALHQANIGLSMGIQGTEVAKESSDIVILDDDFTSVVKVVRWGRSVYSNIQKFLQFQLTVNVAALAVNFVAAVSSGTVPLTAVQLLWVNLIMDTLGALALATEPPTDELMLRPPVRTQEPLITNPMWRNIIGQAAYQVAILLTLQFRGESLLRLSGTDATLINHTVIFNTFVFCQIFNELNARQPYQKNIFRGLLNNRLFVGIVASTIVLQVVMVEFLEKFASTVRLDWQHWVVCIVLASLSWPIAFLLKLIPLPSIPISNMLSFPKRILPCSKVPSTQEA